MRTRCNNPNHQNYHRYGGRGINCLWTSFTDFIRDMGMKPTTIHSIDRIDNDGDYCASNCRWATPLEQASNVSRVGAYQGVPQGFPPNDDPLRFIQTNRSGNFKLAMHMVRLGPPEYIGTYPTLEEAQSVRDVCEYERNVYVNLGLIDN